MVTVPQLSVAATLANQSFRSEVFPEPSHSTVKSSGIVTNSGFSLSSTVTVNEQESVPQKFSTITTTVCVPTSKTYGEVIGLPLSWYITSGSGIPLTVAANSTSAPHCPGSF